MEYVVGRQGWQVRIGKLADLFSSPLSIPPLIAEYRAGALSLRDGNTRYGAMQLLGWRACWAIVWYNTEDDYDRHSKILFGRETARR
jgi:hypothetical protein